MLSFASNSATAPSISGKDFLNAIQLHSWIHCCLTLMAGWWAFVAALFFPLRIFRWSFFYSSILLQHRYKWSNTRGNGHLYVSQNLLLTRQDWVSDSMHLLRHPPLPHGVLLFTIVCSIHQVSWILLCFDVQPPFTPDNTLGTVNMGRDDACIEKDSLVNVFLLTYLTQRNFNFHIIYTSGTLPNMLVTTAKLCTKQRIQFFEYFICFFRSI